ncbi:unnamed protein product [Rotaria sordida]|uniref:Protein-tyrosine-phosphatase n=3 Tax=Rotaria sordida TaxID=392033 RepID=A0A814BQD4_9BILA|nr:unnamed protein product [Rotaria sordida]
MNYIIFKNIHYYLLLNFLFIKFSFISLTIIHEINQVIFLNPQTNRALIRCPLNYKHNFNIEWYNVINNRTEITHNEYYHIYGLQPSDHEFICSSISEINGKYRMKIRIYDRPLPIRHIFIKKRTNTSLTIQWKDDDYNRNANITSYDLILKLNNKIRFRISVNHTQSTYTFLSLYSNTLYSIDISAVDVWKRYSRNVTIIGRTLSSNKYDNISSHKLIDRHLLDQLISCYRLNHQLLLVEFNRSQFLMKNYIYNLTIYNHEDRIILSDNLYSLKQQLPIIKTLNSFIYHLKEQNLRCKIKLIISTIQLEFLGTTYKYCEDFYPIYSPLTCLIKPIKKHKFYLMINMHLYNNHKHIMTLKPNYIFYQIKQNHFIKKNIYDIHKYVTADIFDIKENYSIIVENNLIGSDKNEKINISILCSINRLAPINRNNRISNNIIIIITISLILLSIILIGLVFFIIYQKGLMSNCYHILLHYINSFRKNHHPRSRLVQINNSTNENIEKKFDINYEEFDTISIPIQQFPSYVKYMHKDNDFGFIRLFENIGDLSKTYNFSTDISQIEHNQCKNRYINILTYDHSRVKLSCDENDGKEIYINANYIDGFHKTNAYIATQGPMINTINDFWRMIWEKDVSVLVMITNLKESGRIKCDVYWPLDGTETFGTIQVTLISTISLAYYVKRIFSIRCETNQKLINSERFVHQFHFTNWPDHGVPLFTLPVLSFIRYSSDCNTETGGPIVVHCSAGVGRTGTYIVIDTMLKKIHQQQSINIPCFLKHIRQQRNFLVQTEEQFIFIYDVLNEAAQLSNIGYNNLDLNKYNIDYIIKTLNIYDNDFNLTRIEKQFQLIIEQIKTYNHQLSIGHMEENLAKNRTQAILPLNSCCVLLSTDRKKPDRNYINASYIHGYYRIDQFIITQHPMMNTIIDFWQMIWNTNANIIVSLYGDEKSQSDVPDFWPLANQIMNCGSFIVCLTNEYFEYEYIYRDFLLRSVEENIKLEVKLISCTYWPETCSPIKTSFNLINTIKNLNSIGPIVVHDFFGGHRAATFCALYTMNEQIENEGILNVYELAKFYYLKRPGIWRHHGDLLFLYRCAEILFREYKLSNYDHRC